MAKGMQLPDISEEERTPLVETLLGIIERLARKVQLQEEEIQRLKDEVAEAKGEKKRPKFKPSKLDQKAGKEKEEEEPRSAEAEPPRPRKRAKTAELTIHEDKVIQPEEPIPAGSRFKGYRDFVVQDLLIRPHTIRYRLARWQTAEGETLIGRLPVSLAGRHFGPTRVIHPQSAPPLPGDPAAAARGAARMGYRDLRG
jgi:hypothetical protein